MSEKDDKKIDEGEGKTPEDGPVNRTYGLISFWVGIAALASFALIAVINMYGLIVEIILSLASLAFYSSQKKKGVFPLAKAGQVIGYIGFIAGLLILLGGIIWSAV
ncbi:MAG: hypothetical protein LUD29_01250 [Clostridia bacterium]|nr:hypothetical protein [Clostridia bacterium]